MPWTAKQRALFHAAAARGEKGMAKLADEADHYATIGGELPPVGVAGKAVHDIHQSLMDEDGESGEAWSRLRNEE